MPTPHSLEEYILQFSFYWTISIALKLGNYSEVNLIWWSFFLKKKKAQIKLLKGKKMIQCPETIFGAISPFSKAASHVPNKINKLIRPTVPMPVGPWTQWRINRGFSPESTSLYLETGWQEELCCKLTVAKIEMLISCRGKPESGPKDVFMFDL